jgi:hypothetical protein
VVIFIIEIDNLDFGLVDAKCQPPVLGDRKAPRPFAVTRQLMGFPAWHGFQFVNVRMLSSYALQEQAIGPYGKVSFLAQAGSIWLVD